VGPAIAADPPTALQHPACLSLSPLRALPAARLDSARGAWWRDRLADSLAVRLHGTGWILASAGKCPEGLPILDVFQQPGDLTRDADGALVKLRMEWRQHSGTAVALLSDPDHPEAQLGLWASQTLVTANFQRGQVTLVAEHPVTVLQSSDAQGWKRLGETPLDWSQAPGLLRLRVQANGSVAKDLDTVLEAGQTLRWNIPVPTKPPARHTRLEFSLIGASALCLVGGLWYSLEMERAYTRYSRLDAQSPDDAFGLAWNEVERDNLLRTILLAGSGTLLAGVLYVHFR